MDLFCEIPCLTERSSTFNGLDLCKRWFPKADKRNVSEILHKFVAYNSRQFEFLEITPAIVGTDHSCGITFRTSRYIGAIPLRAPDTGKQIGDFVVAPRFVNRERFEDYIEILDLLGQAISPEIVDSLPLASGRNFRPPFYLEAVKFIVALEQMIRKPWRKFECVEVVRSEPAGQIDWREYVERENRAENKFRFPVRQNVLSEFHREYRQIRSVFDICNMELRSTNVPNRIRNSFRRRLEFVEQKLYLHKPLAAGPFVIKSSDRPAVKNCKEQANRILRREYATDTAWRIDLNDVFKQFIAHIFGKIAHSTGGRLTMGSNDRETKHVEPGAVLHSRGLNVFVYAKYRSHLLSESQSSEIFNEDFDNDVRQVRDHIAAAGGREGIGVICYPSDQLEVRASEFDDSNSSKLLIVGIPLRRSVIPEAVVAVGREIDRARTSTQNDS